MQQRDARVADHQHHQQPRERRMQLRRLLPRNLETLATRNSNRSAVAACDMK